MIESIIPQDAARRVAQRQMRRGDWAGAARSLSGHGAVPELGCLERYCRNLSALAERDPRLAALVAEAPETGRYTLARDEEGRAIIMRRRTPSQDTWEQIRDTGELNAETRAKLDRAMVPGLLGVGDGDFVKALADYHPRLSPGQELAFWVIEPDPEALRQAFLIVDFAGPAGALRQARVQWLVGPDWERDFAQAVGPASFLPPPEFVLFEGQAPSALIAAIREVLEAKRQTLVRMHQENRAYYRALPPRHGLDLFRRRRPRRARVLFVTGAFTTVLQYATADLARAFQELGWETDTVIEDAPHHMNSDGVCIERVHRFRPDLVWVIDHLRHFSPAFPPELPYVSWFMDHLSTLMDPGVGGKIGARDFVLTFNPSLFTDVYGYPARQCLDMPLFLARDVPPRRLSVLPDAPDLVYVSHASETPEAMARRLVGLADPADRPLVEAAVEALVDVYRQGGHCPNLVGDLAAIAGRVCAGRGLRAPRGMIFFLVEVLLSRLNSLLYRQQGLRWVARTADELGVQLGIYGSGWERNPEFGRYARGPVTGEQRDALVSAARINFFLECWPAMSHARLLDALRSGGFVLQRELPLTVLTQRLLRFLAAEVPESVQTLAAARAAVHPGRRAELEELAAALSPQVWTVDGDPVRSTRCWQRMGVFAPGATEALPDLAAVSFRDQASCRERIQRYLEDPEGRAAIARRQNESLGQRLDYRRGVRRTLAFVRRRLREELRAGCAARGLRCAARSDPQRG